MKDKVPYICSCGNFHLRLLKLLSTPLCKHDFQLLALTSIPFFYELPVLPFFIWFYQIFHLPSAETFVHFHVLQYTPFKLLPHTSIPFQKYLSTSFWLIFCRKRLSTSASASIHSHPTTVYRSTIFWRFALRVHGLLWLLRRAKYIFCTLWVGVGCKKKGVKPGWDQVRLECGSGQKLLRTPMGVSLKVEVKLKF